MESSFYCELEIDSVTMVDEEEKKLGRCVAGISILNREKKMMDSVLG